MASLATRFATWTLVAVAALALVSCGGSKKEKLPGERISVLLFDPTLKPDPSLAGEQVALTRPYVNADWPQVDGGPSHTMQHVALGDVPRRAWSSSIGEGSDDSRRLLAQPVVAGGKIYTVDAVAEVRAFRASDGRRLWRTPLKAELESGGGTNAAMGNLSTTVLTQLLIGGIPGAILGAVLAGKVPGGKLRFGLSAAMALLGASLAWKAFF